MDALYAEADQQGTQQSQKGWTPEGVKKILDQANPEFQNYIRDNKVKVIRFDTAFDNWKYTSGAKQGKAEESELTGLRGNSSGDDIRLRSNLSDQEAALMLMHELYHL